MNLISEYRNQRDKIQFFRKLSDEEKKKLYDGLETDEQEHLLFILPFQYLKSFILSLEKDDQKKIYEKLNNTQLKAIYNTLNEVEKKEMEIVLENRQVDFIQELDNAMENINMAREDLEKAQSQIETSAIHQANAKIELQSQKQELKQIRIKFKQLEKKRKKNLKRIKRASRPSFWNRIGIFSKRRTDKLMKVVAASERTNQKIQELRNNEHQVNQNIIYASEQIERERQAILAAKNQILESKNAINENTKAIEAIKVEIKQLSQTEKKLFGRKLYQQRVNERNLLMTQRKNRTLEPQKESIVQSTSREKTDHQRLNSPQQTAQNLKKEDRDQGITTVSKGNSAKSRLDILKEEYQKALEVGDDAALSTIAEEIEKVTPKKVPQQTSTQKSTPQPEPTKKADDSSIKTNSSTKMQNFLDVASKLTTAGVNFYPPTNSSLPSQNNILSEEPIITMTQTQLAVFSYAMAAMIVIEQQRRTQLAQNQDLSQEYSSTVGKSNRAFVSFTLLISILLFIFSFVLFFIA